MDRFKFAVMQIILLCLVIIPAYALIDRQQNVVLITIDGVRHQDFMANKSMFPLFWKNYASLGELAGPGTDKTVQTLSIPLSLPSYLAMMTGKKTDCESNECARSKDETVIDYLHKTLKLKKSQQAVFASWGTIRNAATHSNHSAHVNTGVRHSKNLDNARADRLTYLYAKRYFKKHHPRFLWLSVNDTDEAAHESNRHENIKAMHLADQNIHNLFSLIKKDPDYARNTTIIVTTDHGRGNGDNWITHGKQIPESRDTFLYVANGKSLLAGKHLPPNLLTESSYTNASIRTLIEKAML